MNKEIIKILNELLEIPQSTNGEINFYEIESNKFEAIITLVKKQLEDLEKQLEEKDKIIDKISERLKLLGKYDGETCTRNFKMMSADFNQLLEILERGKNGVDN